MHNRLRAIHSKLDELNLDAILVTSEPNITYLSNFKGEDSYILIDKNKEIYLADFRNYEEARASLNKFTVTQITDSFFKTIQQLVKKLHIKHLGFESKNLDYATFAYLKKCLPKSCKLIPTFDLIEDMRQIKTPQEINLIKKAINITKDALLFARQIIKPAMNENNLVRQIEHFIENKGARGYSFNPIAASGKRSAYPHASRTDKKIGTNTALTLDIGVTFKGYCSDLTRVFFLGKIPRELLNIYAVVREAQARAISKIKPGISAAQIDHEARTTIAKKGFGRFFQHSCGHGIGLEVHEKPSINKKNEQYLVPGMVFTVEPAIYLPSKFGVRIEDIVLVKENGCEVLSGSVDQ
jgi:Xaa-Pro aminopeptidase